jgi:hypothetical protein
MLPSVLSSSSLRRQEALFNSRRAGHPAPCGVVFAIPPVRGSWPSVAVLPPGCRLRGGRFTLLPEGESLFFAGPKKSNPKKWP